MTALNAPRVWALAVVCLLAGCALETRGEAAPEAQTLVDRLERFPALDVIGVHSDAQVVMRLPGTEARGETLPLVVDYGELVVGSIAPRTLLIEHLAFAFDRVEISAARMPPDGTTVDQIRIRMLEPTEAHVAWASDTQARASLVADFEMEWAMVLPDGQIHPLGSERLVGAQVDLDLVLDGDERVLADVDVRLEDVWRWVGLVELRDLDVHLESRERVLTGAQQD